MTGTPKILSTIPPGEWTSGPSWRSQTFWGMKRRYSWMTWRLGFLAGRPVHFGQGDVGIGLRGIEANAASQRSDGLSGLSDAPQRGAEIVGIAGLDGAERKCG